MASKRLGVLSFYGVLLLLLAATVYAGEGVGLTFTPGCTGFTTRGGSLTANRDNTGSGREAFVTTAVDGAGRVLYDSQSVYPINQHFLYGDGTLVAWATAPQSNPIIIAVSSPAGNGQPEQAIYLVTGTCSGLPTVGNGVLALGDNLSVYPIFAAADGRVSPSYDPNSPPPRPFNPPGMVESLPGYAIVNTDNLFLRSGDGAEYSPVGILDGGTQLAVLGSNGQSGDGLWWYVDVGGLRGWAKSEFLILRGDLSAVPVVPVDGSLTQPTLYVGSANPIYGAASAGHALCSIDGNRLYNVVAKNAASASWYRIEATCGADEVLGWIQADRGILRNPGGVDIPVY